VERCPGGVEVRVVLSGEDLRAGSECGDLDDARCDEVDPDAGRSDLVGQSFAVVVRLWGDPTGSDAAVGR